MAFSSAPTSAGHSRFVRRIVNLTVLAGAAMLVGAFARPAAAGKNSRRTDQAQARSKARDDAARQAPPANDKEKAALSSVPADSSGDDGPLAPVIEFGRQSREALKEVKDYTAVFTKTELVGNKLIKQSMDMKFREKPFSVYFRFRSRSEAGREVIYVHGANNNRLLVHEVGIKAIAGTLPFKPDDHKVMEENRYPITKVGISNMLETAFAIWEVDKKDPAVDVKFFPNAKLGEQACQAVQITHPQPLREQKFHLSRIYFDKETKLPVRAERFGWPRKSGDQPPLLEEYSYTNLKKNVGLTNADFDVRNPNYGF